jgi:hypothetical protein
VIIQVPVSVGEMLDKMSILRIKLKNFKDEARKANVRLELGELDKVAEVKGLRHPELEGRLDEINGRLWDIEDELRVLETRQDFGQRFIELARAVYYTNDERADAKRELNQHFGSTLVEEKEYVDYKAAGSDRPA